MTVSEITVLQDEKAMAVLSNVSTANESSSVWTEMSGQSVGACCVSGESHGHNRSHTCTSWLECVCGRSVDLHSE